MGGSWKVTADGRFVAHPAAVPLWFWCHTSQNLWRTCCNILLTYPFAYPHAHEHSPLPVRLLVCERSVEGKKINKERRKYWHIHNNKAALAAGPATKQCQPNCWLNYNHHFNGYIRFIPFWPKNQKLSTKIATQMMLKMANNNNGCTKNG